MKLLTKRDYKDSLFLYMSLLESNNLKVISEIYQEWETKIMDNYICQLKKDLDEKSSSN